MGKNNCLNCANDLGGTYCTRQLNMDVAKYKKCNGWKDRASIPIKKKSVNAIPVEKKRRFRDIPLEELSTDMQRFIRKGGHYSARTNKFIINV